MSLAEDERGVTVADFENASCAGRAGIRRDDVIVAVDGVAVQNAQHLIDLVGRRTPGQKIEIAVRRGETETAVTVTLAGGAKR